MPSDPLADASTVVSRSFALSPSALRDMQELVRRHLRPSPKDVPDSAAVAVEAARAAAEQADHPVRLTMLLFSDHVEVTIGSARDSGEGFRGWLAAVLRRERLSQGAAARRLGVSIKTVNRWLRGHSEPRMRDLRRLREVFGEPPLS